jgi:hypothetical protein
MHDTTCILHLQRIAIEYYLITAKSRLFLGPPRTRFFVIMFGLDPNLVIPIRCSSTLGGCRGARNGGEPAKVAISVNQRNEKLGAKN